MPSDVHDVVSHPRQFLSRLVKGF